jgi:hypothetical protein
MKALRRVLHLLVSASLLAALIVTVEPAPRAFAFTFTITPDADPSDDIDVSLTNPSCETIQGTCTLRAAIMQANYSAGPDTIILPSGVYTLTLDGAGEDDTYWGDLDLTSDITITGAGANTTIIDAQEIGDRVFHVLSGTVRISGVTIRYGAVAGENGGGVWHAGGNLTLAGMAVLSNTATISNTVGGLGGGVYTSGGTLTVENSLFSANQAANGGGLDLSAGAADVRSTTFSGNSATNNGGGVLNEGASLTLTNATFSGNSAASGGGLNHASGASTVRNSIIANSTGANCLGSITDGGNNLQFSDSTCGGFTTTDPKLSPLADNNGQPQTHALLSGSPAISGATSAANPAFCPTTDQRGLARRTTSGYCDIGAYEVQPGAVTKLAGSGQSATITQAFTTDLKVEVRDIYGALMPGATVTFTAPAAGPSATFSANPLTALADGTATMPTTTANGLAGSYVVTATAGSIYTQFNLTNNKGSTTTTLGTRTPSPSVVGQPVTVNFSVTSPYGTPTGNVTVSDGSVNCSATVATGNCALTFTTAGSKNLTVTYAGDSNFSGSNTTVNSAHTVNKANTATALVASLSTSVFGQSVTFTATVSVSAPGAGNPTGSVAFKDGAATLGTVTLSGGAAVFTTSGLAAGAHTITAQYNGNSNFNGSTSPAAAVTVNKANTTASLASSRPGTVLSETVTFTATVLAVAPGAGTVTGTVTFKDGSTPLGAVSLSGGKAVLTTSFSVLGTHTITAEYAGNSNFNVQTSSPLNHLVTQFDTSTTLASAPNPSVFGQPATFTATVGVLPPGSGTPVGMVIFKDGGVELGTAALSNGVAVFTTTVLAPGEHTITAEYAGDTVGFAYNPSASAPLAHQVTAKIYLPFIRR